MSFDVLIALIFALGFASFFTVLYSFDGMRLSQLIASAFCASVSCALLAYTIYRVLI